MPINQFQAPSSPIDAISKALGVANTVYGLKHAAAAQDLAEQQLAESKQKTSQEATTFGQTQAKHDALADPDSNESKTSKLGALVALSSAKNTSAYKKDPSAVDSLIKQISDPSTTGLQANEISESPVLKAIEGNVNKDMGVQFLAASLANRNSNTQEKTELAANKDYRKEMSPYEGTIQAANRANSIIDQIRTGGLKSTPTLRNDLNAAVGSMFNNGKGATVYGMSHSDQASLEGKINSGIGYITGTAQDTIPTEQLDQLQKDIGSLRGEYSKAHQVAFDSFKEGLPDRVRPKLEARFNQFRNSVGIGDQGGDPGSSSGGFISSANASSPVSPGTHIPMDDIQAEIARRAASKKGK